MYYSEPSLFFIFLFIYLFILNTQKREAPLSYFHLEQKVFSSHWNLSQNDFYRWDEKYQAFFFSFFFVPSLPFITPPTHAHIYINTYI
ncbi:hypothetical protein J3Q64DRAFT_1769747, partial [Phycomyces blakesleeanus]